MSKNSFIKISAIVFIFVLIAILAGCSQNIDIITTYNPPPHQIQVIKNTVKTNGNKEEIWGKLIEGIGSKFFIINNMDKQSGFLNVSYSGDAKNYVEGGSIHLEFGKTEYVSHPELDKDFPATLAYVESNTRYGIYRRSVNLEGRANVVVTEIDSTHTSVSVNIKYILEIDVTAADGSILHQTVNFNTGQSGHSSDGYEYYSNGNIENAILNPVR